MVFKVENLIVWQKAVDLSAAQIKRDYDSISLNIAEGSTGQTTLEFKKFLGYAIRSSVEVVTCLYLARKRTLVDGGTFDKYYEKLTELIKGCRHCEKR